MIGAMSRTAVCAALYGYALGAAHSDLYAARNIVKFPLLIAVTATVCALSYWLTARVMGARLGFAAAQRIAWRLFHDTTLLLASLSPAVLFVAWATRATDDGRLGDYDTILALNVMAVATAGTTALRHQARTLAGAVPGTRGPWLLVGAWLLLTLGVGGQAAFYLRPFFGFPASRGGRPPFFLGTTPDVRGATSFYGAVWQTITRPPLPDWFGARR
jgi:hypothetical protein